jgi:hypothetical protein
MAPPLAALAAEREELAREREIRANLQVTLSDGISASALISALQAEHDKARFVTPPNQHSQVVRSPSSHASTSSTETYRHRRFSVDELGSPSFCADRLRINPIPSGSIEVELVEPPASAGQSPLDIKLEDAPRTPSPHRIPGAWSSTTHIKFGEFGADITVVYRPVADDDDDIDIPDAPPEESRYKREVQLFDSKGAPPWVSLPPTPIQQRPITVPKVVEVGAQKNRRASQVGHHSRRHILPPHHTGPGARAPLLPEAAPNSSISARQYRSKATQTDTDMTSKKIEALEEIMKQLILGNEIAQKEREAKEKADHEYREKQQSVMEGILEGLQRGLVAPEDKTREARRQALEAKRQQKLAAVEEELHAEFEEVGLDHEASVSATDVQREYEEVRDREQPLRDRYTTEKREYGTVQEWKSENVKVEQVGLIQPLPPHAEWTGQILEPGSSTVYVSLKGWLDHVEAVLSQKDIIQ